MIFITDFPYGCITYEQPFPIDCVETIANRFNITGQLRTSLPVLTAAEDATNLKYVSIKYAPDNLHQL